MQPRPGGTFTSGSPGGGVPLGVAHHRGKRRHRIHDSASPTPDDQPRRSSVRRPRRGFGLLALLLCFGLVAAACSSDKKTSTSSGSTSSSSQAIPKGGTITIGAEQELKCADWIDACGSSSWGFWTLGVNSMPRAFDVLQGSDGKYDYKASNLLTGEPKFVASPKETVTYTISDKAVWSDGQPI